MFVHYYLLTYLLHTAVTVTNVLLTCSFVPCSNKVIVLRCIV